jgi:hypothetical protein
LADAQVSSTETKFYRLAGRGRRFLEEHTDPTGVISIPLQLPRALRHFTAVNDLRLAFETGLLQLPVALDYFHTEREYFLVGRRSDYLPQVLLRLLGGSRLTPDAIVGLKVSGSVYDLAIEYDSGTELSYFFGRAKMRQYLDCFAKFPSEFDEFKILVVAPSLKRLINLMRQTVQVQPGRGRFYFALLSKFQLPSWASAPIFLDPTEYFVMANEGEKVRVVEKPYLAEPLPKHSLTDLFTVSPNKFSPRQESQNPETAWQCNHLWE